jgi:serine/threonine protein kinase
MVVPNDSDRAAATVQPGEDDPLAGTGYRAIELLGQGGMGRVYLAEHVVLGKHVVVKILRDDIAVDARLLDRMRLEAQALGRLQHPNIVEVTDCGRTPWSKPYLVTEWLQGRTLADEIRQVGALGVHEAVRLVRQLLSALAAAHQIGIVHRDIKPSNLFLHHPPRQPRTIKVLDFGVAKVLEGAPSVAPRPLALPTEEGCAVGTPRFISPEGLAGRKVDHRADLYAAGLVLYALLCGRGPWDHEKRGPPLVDAQLHGTPRPPSAYAAEPIAVELDSIVMRALARRPEDRYQSAIEFDSDLAGVERAASAPVGWLQTSVYEPEEQPPTQVEAAAGRRGPRIAPEPPRVGAGASLPEPLPQVEPSGPATAALPAEGARPLRAPSSMSSATRPVSSDAALSTRLGIWGRLLPFALLIGSATVVGAVAWWLLRLLGD